MDRQSRTTTSSAICPICNGRAALYDSAVDRTSFSGFVKSLFYKNARCGSCGITFKVGKVQAAFKKFCVGEEPEVPPRNGKPRSVPTGFLPTPAPLMVKSEGLAASRLPTEVKPNEDCFTLQLRSRALGIRVQISIDGAILKSSIDKTCALVAKGCAQAAAEVAKLFADPSVPSKPSIPPALNTKIKTSSPVIPMKSNCENDNPSLYH
jgi:hypothetical protein